MSGSAANGYRSATTTCVLPGEPFAAGLPAGGGGGGGHAGRRPLPDAGRERRPGRDHSVLERKQSGLLPELRLVAIEPRSTTASAAKFLDRVRVARLTAQMPGRGGGGGAERQAKSSPRGRRRRVRKATGPRRLVRTVVATTADNEAFGWQVAAEVHRRGLDRARAQSVRGGRPQGGVGVLRVPSVAAGFIAILDFLQLLSHLYAAACAVEPKGTEAAWALYTQWLCWAWSGKVLLLLGGLRAVCKRLGPAPAGASEDDPRKVAADTLGYVGNNRGRMDYPEYRRLGLPISMPRWRADQAAEPPGEGEREVLAAWRGRGRATGACGLPERGRAGGAVLGATPAASPRWAAAACAGRPPRRNNGNGPAASR